MASQVIAVASQKGGVGKTTLALNTACALARRTWRTVLVDVDPQGSVGFSIEGTLHQSAGLAEVLAGTAALGDVLVQTRLGDLSILPVGQVEAAEGFSWSTGLEDGRALSEVFAALRESFDLVVVDTPPAMHGVALGTLRCADHVVIPLQAEPLAARSVRQLLDVLASLQASGAEVQLAGLILTMLQSRQEASLGVAQESWRLFPEELIFEATVPRDPTFVEASAAGVPVSMLSRRPPAVAAVFDQIAAELETRIGCTGEGDEIVSLLG